MESMINEMLNNNILS